MALPNQPQGFMQRAAQFFNAGGNSQNANAGNPNSNVPGARSNQNPDLQGNNQQQGNGQDQQTQDPFNAYADLWKAPTENDGEKTPRFQLDPAVINRSADSLDFVRNMPEDMRASLEEVFGTNAEKGSALLNYVARQAYASAIQHGTALTDRYLDVRGQHEGKKVGKTVKEQLALNSIDSMEAAKKSPIVKENLRLIAQNLSRTYPDADPQWIQEKTQEFFVQMATAVNPQKDEKTIETEQRKAPGGEDFDWDSWLAADKARQ